MIRFIVLILLLPIILSANPFEIIQETEDFSVVKFTLPHYSVNRRFVSGIEYSEIICSNANITNLEGYPQLPFFTEIFGIPADGNLSIDLIEKKQVVVNDICIIPNAIISTDGNSVSPETFRTEDIYTSEKTYPYLLIEKGSSGFISQRRFASVLVNPFQFEAKANRLTVTRELVFRINISGSKKHCSEERGSNSFTEKYGNSIFLNNKTSSNWILPREKSHYTPSNRSINVNKIQFVIDREGIYKVTYEYLTENLSVWQDSLGFSYTFGDWNSVDPRYLELSDESGQIPIRFVGESDGSFDPGDYFEFFGNMHFGDVEYHDDYTSENVYTLTYTGKLSVRMAVENGGIQETNPNNLILPIAYEQTINIQEQNFFDRLNAYKNAPREDLWFWRKFSAPNMEVIPFVLDYPYQSSDYRFSAKVSLLGSTHLDNISNDIPDHHAFVRINNSLIGNHYWFRQSEQIFQNQPLPNEYLSHGNNNLYVSLPGDTPATDREQILLDYLEITYWREYKTDNDYITFTKPSDRQYGLYQFQLENFSSELLHVYKKNASYIENITIDEFESGTSTKYKITFQDEVFSDQTVYIAVSETKKMIPKLIRPDIPSDLKSPMNSARYIIVTSPEFSIDEGTLLLQQTWQEQGLNTMIVTTQDIYDEFNSGIRSAEAIKTFFAYAYNNWAPPQLTHVLLLGDGVYDERDNSVARNFNIIPFKNIWTYKHGATASDNWYSCIVGDDYISDFNISRINVWSADQIMPVVEKTIRYINNPDVDKMWQTNITLSAGGKNTDNNDVFAIQSENIRRGKIPEYYLVNRVYTAVQTVPIQYQGGTFDLKDAINEGSIFVQFMGHGGGRIWADYNLLNYNDISTLNNSVYPFVSSMSCYGSAFDTMRGECMGEAMILSANKGAIAQVGFTGLGYINGDLIFSQYLTEAIFQLGISNIGDAVTYAKAKFFASYSTNYAPNDFEMAKRALTQGCALIGDPAINLHLPIINDNIFISNYTPEEGDTIVISLPLDNSFQQGRVHILDDLEMSAPGYFTYPFPVTNGILSTKYTLPVTTSDIYERFIKVYAYNDEIEYAAFTKISVGKENVIDLLTIPKTVTENDSVAISGRFFHPEGIERVECYVNGIDNAIPGGPNRPKRFFMFFDQIEKKYVTIDKIVPLPAGRNIDYFFKIFTNSNSEVTTRNYSYRVESPDLAVMHTEFTISDNQPAIKLLVKNLGKIDSGTFTVKIFEVKSSEFGRETLITEITGAPIPSMSQNWHIIPLPFINQDSIQLRIKINIPASFGENNFNNNMQLMESFSLNSYWGGLNELTIESSDQNFVCSIPSNTLPQDTSFFL
ncbi:MAG: C25 family cysteine peptidase, partial [Candidatus Cloacimonetes bacterium]|nr:C25 family cysteine peptidase [Candidatus Cloacimonadota bacterium]